MYHVCNYCMMWFSHKPVYSKHDKRKLIPFCSVAHRKLAEREVKEWPR